MAPCWHLVLVVGALVSVSTGETDEIGEIKQHQDSQHQRTLIRREPVDAGDTCKPYPGKRVVLVAVDNDFADFFDNWLLHADKFLTQNEQVVVIADDSEVIPKLENLRKRKKANFKILKSELPPASALEIGERATPYGTMGYNNLMHQRPAHLHRLVQQGCAVLFVDVDTVWLKNPFKDIDAAGSHDLYVIDDGSNGGSKEPKQRWNSDMMSLMTSKGHDCKIEMPNFCGCFQYMKPTKAMIQLAGDWSAVSLSGQYKNEGNQHAFNHQLCKHIQASHKNQTKPAIDFAVLPWLKFPPGPVAKVSPEDVTIMHANWLAGHTDKMNFMKSMGHWNVSQAA